MSATHSNSRDGDLEAIQRAQRAHEPSMEEILASIRNIIADDPAKGTAPKPQQAPAPMPPIVYSSTPGAARRRLRIVPAPGRERADGRLASAASGRNRASPPMRSSEARSRCCRRRRARRQPCRSGP